MNRTKKSTRKQAPRAAAQAMDVADLTGFYMQGVQQIAEMQKGCLDFAAQQNAEAFELCRKALKAGPPLPGMFVLDVAKQAVERLVATEKNIIDLFVSQNKAMVEAAKARCSSASNMASELSKKAQRSIDRGVALHKSGIEFAAEQSKAIGESFEEKFGLDGTPAAAAAASFRKGVDALFETQKDLLDAATKPLKSTAAKSGT